MSQESLCDLNFVRLTGEKDEHLVMIRMNWHSDFECSDINRIRK